MSTSLRFNHTNSEEVNLNAVLILTVLHLILDISFSCVQERPVSTGRWEEEGLHD